MTKEKEEQNTFDDIVEAIDSLEPEADRHLSIQLDRALREATRAARESGQPASVTLSVKIKQGADRRVAFSANVAAKIPRPPVCAVQLYADKDGNVHRADPDQLRMQFPAPTPIRNTKEI